MYFSSAVSSLGPENMPSGGGIRLYKGEILSASVFFAEGKVIFHRLKEGSYRLEIFDNGGSIEYIDLPILEK